MTRKEFERRVAVLNPLQQPTEQAYVSEVARVTEELLGALDTQQLSLAEALLVSGLAATIYATRECRMELLVPMLSAAFMLGGALRRMDAADETAFGEDIARGLGLADLEGE